MFPGLITPNTASLEADNSFPLPSLRDHLKAIQLDALKCFQALFQAIEKAL
jgi:hypothetical protein